MEFFKKSHVLSHAFYDILLRFEPVKVPKRVTSGLLYVGVKYYLKS